MTTGVRTPLGGLYTGILVIASLFLTPLFYYIPKAALASIIIAAVIFMIEVRVVKPMWRSKSKLNVFDLLFLLRNIQHDLMNTFFLFDEKTKNRNRSNSGNGSICCLFNFTT